MLSYTPVLVLMAAADVDHQRIAALLRGWRFQLGWSRAQVAAAAGLTLEPVKQMERGAAQTLDNLVAVLPIYGRTLEDVLDGAVPAELLSGMTGPPDGAVRASVHAGAVRGYTLRIAELEGDVGRLEDEIKTWEGTAREVGGLGPRARAPRADKSKGKGRSGRRGAAGSTPRPPGREP